MESVEFYEAQIEQLEDSIFYLKGKIADMEYEIEELDEALHLAEDFWSKNEPSDD